MDSGFPIGIFVAPIDERLMCRLCNQVLRSPKTTPCGHVYCKGCIERWVSEHAACPQRCCEVAAKNLAWAGHIDTLISGLKTRCKNSGSGCEVQVPLSEKSEHESVCPHNDTAGDEQAPCEPRQKEDVEVSRGNSTEPAEKESLGFFQRTKLVLSFRSARSARRKAAADAKAATSSSSLDDKGKESQAAGNMHSQRTFRLKRNRRREPLGLVLVSGDKTGDGRHQSYYVKKVNRDTLGWRAGILAGDRIIKVDNHDLCQLTPQESVARIKENTVVTITVLRDMGASRTNRQDSHIYDEIMYAELSQQNQSLSQPLLGLSQPSSTGMFLRGLSQQDENQPPTPPPIDFSKLSSAAKHFTSTDQGSNDLSGHRPQKQLRSTSPGTNCTYRIPLISGQGERTSKDSGLSSGSSNSPNHTPHSKQSEGRPTVTENSRLQVQATQDIPQDMDRDITARRSYRTGREMLKTILKDQRRNSPSSHNPASSKQPVRSRNRRIVGDYELEDISLEKNGTSQLGITLGYDSSATHGSCLYVCEIVAGGLAAQDGRLRPGDIIKRVNGFQVDDPEEAILLFLEQDQDIQLSVARKIKVPSKFRPRPEADLEYLESALLRDGLSIRKVDSCGSLDSHTHHVYATLEPPEENRENTAAVHREGLARSRDLHLMATSHDNLIDDHEGAYHGRRGSTPGQANPLGNLRHITGSSPNLLRVTSGAQRSPPSLYHGASGSNLHSIGNPTGRQRSPQDRLMAPDSKHRRPLGGVQRKRSTPSPIETLTTPLDHEPKIMIPPSPTQVPTTLRAVASDIRRLPNRFDSNSCLDPSSAGAQGRRESLV